MRSARVQRWVMLAFLATAVALVLGGDTSATSLGDRTTPAGAGASFTSPVRLPDLVVRSDADRDDRVIAKLSANARLLMLLGAAASGLLAMLVQARRRMARNGAHLPSTFPRRHSVVLRAPPVLRLI